MQKLHPSILQQPFLELFPGDKSLNPSPRQTPNDLYCLVEAQHFLQAKLQHFNASLAQDLGLDICPKKDFAWLSGQLHQPDFKLYATAYAGHQFGQWAGQLGDGRAILLGEILGQEWQWKGLGPTPYARHADGRAVWRSSLREYLMSEAMQHLGIPSTRALALVDAGDHIWRDPMYNQNPVQEPAAVVLRVAPSFIRFGHFELLAARKQKDLSQKLCLWIIQKHFPQIDTQQEPQAQIIQWFAQVAQRTQQMILGWLRVGFCHGVMNTDNLSVLGLSIDYGPFGMMDAYQRLYTPNTSDGQQRYAFARQAQASLFNLNALANALLPLLKDAAPLEAVLNDYAQNFKSEFLNMMRRKFGLCQSQADDEKMLELWEILMEELKIDYTLFFVCLMNLEEKTDILKHFESAFYQNPSPEQAQDFMFFIQNYLLRKQQNAITQVQSKQMMQESNPQFVLRNHLLYEAYQGLLQGDDALLNELFLALQKPYENMYPHLQSKAPAWAEDTVGCSRLSCSS